MLTLPASYCEPAFSLTRLAVTILNLSLSKKQFHCFCLLVIENENRVVVCALRCRRGKKAQKNERITTEYAQMSTKCAQICLHFLILLLTLYFYRRHRPWRCTAANFREVESKRERLFTLPEIWANNNSVSVSEVYFSEGGDVTMSSSTSSSCQQISTTSDVYYLLDDDNDTWMNIYFFLILFFSHQLFMISEREESDRYSRISLIRTPLERFQVPTLWRCQGLVNMQI